MWQLSWLLGCLECGVCPRWLQLRLRMHCGHCLLVAQVRHRAQQMLALTAPPALAPAPAPALGVRVTPREPGLPPPIPSRGFGNLGFKVHEGFINNVSEFPLDNGSRVCTSRDLFCHRPLF